MSGDGDVHDAEKKYTEALHWYDRAIELDESNAIYYANRAFTHIRMEKLGAAIADATQAIELDPNYVKVVPYLAMKGNYGCLLRATTAAATLSLRLDASRRH